MMNEERKCPYCNCSLKNNTSLFVCMNCGHSLTPEKKFDNVDADEIGRKDENATNFFVSANALWWALLIIGSIVLSISSFSLLFEIL